MKSRSFIRHLMAIFLLLASGLSVCAQELTDSVFRFRFVSLRNMFYVPYKGNDQELERLLECVGKYKNVILKHPGCVKVNGYCDSQSSAARNLAVAKIRSNRVKSEMITRKGLTEQCFTTRNHSGGGNYVIVNFIIPKDSVEKYQSTPKEVTPPAPEVTQPEPEVAQTLPEPAIPEGTFVEESVEQIDVVEAEEPQIPTPEPISCKEVTVIENFAVKTNLLYYAILMPNIEVEWMCAKRWSVNLEFQGAWYAKENPHKVYRLSTLIPEVRYWPIERKRWHGMYVGLFLGGGLYDLSNGKKGHEGEGIMTGVSAGYMWPISKHLSLDAGLGVGYMYLRDKYYLPENGHFLYQYTKKINYFGPLRLNLSLVWRIPREKTITKNENI